MEPDDQPAPMPPGQSVEPGQAPHNRTPEEVAAEAAADRQARIDYLKSLQKPKRQRSLGKWLLWGLMLVVLAGGGAGAYWYFTKPKATTPRAATTTNQNSQTVSESTTPVSAAETYNATGFSLTIKYPKQWVPAEADGKLTITSPATRFNDSTGSSIIGQIVVTVAAKGQQPTAFDAGNATAVLDSEKLTYAQPTEVQRAQTYLSFAQYATTTASGSLDAMFVTGDYGYLKGQAIPKVDMQNLDPLLSVTFLKCANASCGTAQPVAIQASSWSKPVFSTPIKTTLESLAIN